MLRSAIYDTMKVMSSIDGVIKSRGRPATGHGTPVTVRLQPGQLAQLDTWISEQSEPQPTRPEAVRIILARQFCLDGN